MISSNKPTQPGWRRTIVIQVLLLFALFGGVLYFNPPASETPAQVEQRRQTDARIAERTAARSTHRSALCQVLSVCVAYKEARNDCAIAANFNNCLRIKLGDSDYDKLMFCNDDGTLASQYLADPAPETLECWLRNNIPFYR
jgi:hypothetical protein